MKKKYFLINLFMSLTVLFTMLFQTIHSYEHIYKQITEKHCVHSYDSNQKQITHSHSVDNNCPICHFAFSTFIPNSFNSLTFQKISVTTDIVSFYTTKTTPFFKGSLFALRAPPTVI